MEGTGTKSGVWLFNKPTDLSTCVSEECGHGKGGVVYATLVSDTLYPNGRTETGTSPGVWLLLVTGHGQCIDLGVADYAMENCTICGLTPQDPK